MITFHEAKDGNTTCTTENIHLHSAYSPIQEAKRFSDSLESPFIPKAIIIIEPCISYCADFIKEKFPDCKIAAIRFSSDFKKYDSHFDKIFNLDDLESNPDLILEYFGEEMLCACFIASWPPSEKAFQKQLAKTVEILKIQIQKARDILGTRSFFASRWILNTINFAKNIKKLQDEGKTYEITSGNAPVIIAASGPSLKNVLPTLKKLQDENKNYFLIAASSAYMTLKKHGIKIDLCITTDGGFYAKKHIEIPGLSDDSTVWAVASEGAFPKNFFAKKKILPLSYQDGVEKEILDTFGVKAQKIERNGTVSGTALKFAKSITQGEIFLLGLDLGPTNAYQHTQPNAIDCENEAKQNRLATKETHLARSRFSSKNSLSIYEQWFSGLKESEVKNVYRIKENHEFSNKLGRIQEKNAKFLEDTIKKHNEHNEKTNITLNKTSKTVYNNIKFYPQSKDFSDTVYKNTTKPSIHQSFLQPVYNIIQNNFVDIFPLENVLFSREKNAGKRSEFELKLKEKEENLVRKIRTL